MAQGGQRLPSYFNIDRDIPKDPQATTRQVVLESWFDQWNVATLS
jgi:hypothetical protein